MTPTRVRVGWFPSRAVPAAILAIGVAVGLTACGTENPMPSNIPSSASTPTTTQTPSPAGGVVARLELPVATLRSGASVAARITLCNNSGGVIRLLGCGSMYAALLVGTRHHPTASWPLCAQPITIPQSERTYTVHVGARYNECSPNGGQEVPACLPDGSMPGLPPGSYAVTAMAVSDEVPIPAPIFVRVTP